MPHAQRRSSDAQATTRRGRRRRQRRGHRPLSFERLESRRLLAATWRNPGQALDVNDDLVVSSIDALLGINRINQQGAMQFEPRDPDSNEPFYDTNGDGFHSSIDVLRVINGLNATVPIVAARLANDTAPGGAVNRDRLTSDPAIDAGVSGALAVLKAGFGGIDPAEFVDVSASFNNGRFEIDGAALAVVYGGPLPDGRHTVQLQAERDGQESEVFEISFTLDTRGPVPQLPFDGPVRVPVEAFDVQFNEEITPNSLELSDFELRFDGGPQVPIHSISAIDRGVRLQLDDVLVDEHYELTVTAVNEDLAGNSFDPADGVLPFVVATPPSIAWLSPIEGETLVNVTRETIVAFDEPVDPDTVNEQTFYVIAHGEQVPGRVRVSSNERLATFFYDEPLPDSSLVRVVLEGDQIIGRDGRALDADGDTQPGGRLQTEFRTLPLTRIVGTSVFGFVRDSYTGEPIAGATIRVDAFPEANAVTDAAGRFELTDMPAPVFFVHIDGSTASSAPAGFRYPNVGKPFHSVAGETVQLQKEGQPFDIFLPPMADSDVQPLSPTGPTDVGFGAAGKSELATMLPSVDPSAWERMRVTLQPNSALDEQGAAATTAAVIPVPPDRIPAPLPSSLDPQLVISVQAPGATNFEAPVPISFPNIDGLAPGERSLIFSFDHDAGAWRPTAPATVSADGLTIDSDPDTGLLAPGWHINSGQGCNRGNAPRPEALQPDSVVPVEIRDPIIQLIRGDQPVRFTTSFAAGGSAPGPRSCTDTTPRDDPDGGFMDVKIEIDGPLNLFVKATGSISIGEDVGTSVGLHTIAEQTFRLVHGTGDEEILDLTARTYEDMFGPDILPTAVGHDLLLGARMRITRDYYEGPVELVASEQQDVYLYRYISVAHAEEASSREGNTAAFHRTEAMPGGVGIVREKGVLTQVPDTFDTHFVEASDEYFLESPVRGWKVGKWQYIPDSPGSLEEKAIDVMIQADGHDIGTIRVAGTASPPAIIALDIVGLHTTLREVFSGLTVLVDQSTGDIAARFTAGNGTIINASSSFLNEFEAELRAKAMGDDEPLLFQVGVILAEMEKEVRQDFGRVNAEAEPATSGDPAFRIVQDAFGSVVPSWVPACNSHDGRICYFEKDVDRARLEPILLDETLPSEAKEWALAETLNQIRVDEFPVAVAGVMGYPSRTTFARQLANAVLAGAGLHMGLNVGYYQPASLSYSIELPPHDALGFTYGDRTYGEHNRTLLLAATGRHRNSTAYHPEISAAREFYEFLFNTPNDPHQLMPPSATPAVAQRSQIESEPPAAPAPGLLVLRDDEAILPEQVTFFSEVAADGAGGALADLDFVLTNPAVLPLTVAEVSLAGGSGGFTITAAPPGGTVLEPGESTTVSVRFDPTAVGALMERLTVSSDDPAFPAYSIELSGTSIASAPQAVVALAPAAPGPGLDIAIGNQNVNNNFGAVRLSEPPVARAEMFQITNRGANDLTISEIRPVDGAAEFALLGWDGTVRQLATGETLTLGVSFQPSELGLQRGVFEIVTNDPDNPVQRVSAVGYGLAENGRAEPSIGEDFAAIQLDDDPPVRTRSNLAGRFEFFLPPGRPYRTTVFDPQTGFITQGGGTTAAVLTVRDVTSTLLPGASLGPDSDFDGLPDDAEFAIGTSPDRIDSDGDGIDDYVETRRGLDPLGERSFPVGIVGSVELADLPLELVVDGGLAYVGHSRGLSIVDISDVELPIVVGAFESADVGFRLFDLDVDVRLGVAAAVDASDQFHFLDISDPVIPRLRQSVTARAGSPQRIEVGDGLAYVLVDSPSEGTRLDVFDLITGELLSDTVISAAGGAANMTRAGATLYAFADEGLVIVDVSNALVPRVLGRLPQTSLPVGGGSKGGIVAADGVLWMSGSLGFNRLETVAIDVSDPARPTVLSGSDLDQQANGLALNGSGLAVINRGGDPLLNVNDVSDPSTDDRFLFSVPLAPVNTNVSVPHMEIARGLGVAAVVTDDIRTELTVFNHLSVDTAGQPPVVALDTPLADLDLARDGLQLSEGTTIPLAVTVVEDVQLSEIELLVDGRVVDVDVSYPWEFSATALASAPGTETLTIQLRASDTGGNVGLSNLLIVEAVPDTTPPTVAEIRPADASTGRAGTQAIHVRFDEPMDAATIDAASIQLRSGGSALTPTSVLLRNDDRLVQLTFDPLPAGVYEIRIDGGVTDRAGNPLAGGVTTTQFTLGEPADRANRLFIDRIYPLTGHPDSFAAGDLNGDRLTDVVTLNSVGGFNFGVSILLNAGDGSLGKETRVPLADLAATESLKLIDLNHDGHLDIFFIASLLTGAQQAMTLLGDADGTFGIPLISPLTTTRVPAGVALGDVTGDGQLDLMLGFFGGSALLTGNGDGTFGNEGPISTDVDGISTGPIAIGDIDCDLDLDLVLQLGSSLAVLRNDGNNGFDFPEQRFDIRTPGLQDGQLQLADVDEDDDLDVAVASAPSGFSVDRITLLLNDGTGMFDQGTDVLVVSSPGGLSGFEFVDFTGEGDLDLVVNETRAVAGMTVLSGAGTGSFTETARIVRQVGEEMLPLSFGALADIDQDNTIDVITSTRTATDEGFLSDVSIVYGDGQGNLVLPNHMTAPDITLFATARDINDDQHADLIAVGLPDSKDELIVSIAFGMPNGAFSAPIETRLADAGGLGPVEIGADGRLVAVVQFKAPADPVPDLEYMVLEPQADGSVVVIDRQNLADSSFDNRAAALELVDVNNDTREDMLLLWEYFDPGSGVSDGAYQVYTGNEDGTFSFFSEGVFPGSTAASSFAVADLDGDANGFADLLTIVRPRNGDDNIVAILPGNGTGSFAEFVDRVEVDVGSEALAVRVVDLDEDQVDDIVALRAGGVSVLFGSGGGQYAAAVLTDTRISGNAVASLSTAVENDQRFALADFDDDDRLDLLILTGGAANMALLLGNGDGTFQRTDYFVPDETFSQQTTGLFVIDIDKDGDQDILTADGAFGTITVRTNRLL